MTLEYLVKFNFQEYLGRNVLILFVDVEYVLRVDELIPWVGDSWLYKKRPNTVVSHCCYS